MAKLTQNNTKRHISGQKLVAVDLYFKGKTQTQIAKDIGKHRRTIVEWFKRPEVIEEVNRRVGDIERYARERAASLVGMSIDALQDVVNEGGDTGKVQAAKELLKLAGLEKDKGPAAVGIVLNITQDAADIIERRG